MLLQPWASSWMALPLNNLGWNYGRKWQIWPDFIDLWPYHLISHPWCFLYYCSVYFQSFHRILSLLTISGKSYWRKIKFFRDFSLTFDLNIWPLTSFALLIYLSFPFLPSFQIYLLLAILAWRNSWNSWFSAILHWPLTSNLTSDPYCQTIFCFFSFWPSLPSFIDIWHFRQKLWM